MGVGEKVGERVGGGGNSYRGCGEMGVGERGLGVEAMVTGAVVRWGWERGWGWRQWSPGLW